MKDYYLSIIFILLLNSCVKNDGILEPIIIATESSESLILPSPTASPIEGYAPIQQVKFIKDIPYGNHNNMKFDLFQVQSNIPTPLVIYIHGGGFTSGDKSSAYGKQVNNKINTFIDNGISFISMNYRLIQDSTCGISVCFNDAKYFIQFVRYYSHVLNIDPSKIAVYGSSSGAGISLWLALNDDMKDSNSANPILQESTKITAVGAIATQSTYDIIKWEKIFSEYNFNVAKYPDSTRILDFYAINSLSELYSPNILDYRNKFEILSKIDGDDPDMWIYNEMEYINPVNSNILLHHPYHALAIKSVADSVGLKNSSFYIPGLGIINNPVEDLESFLISRLIL